MVRSAPRPSSYVSQPLRNAVPSELPPLSRNIHNTVRRIPKSSRSPVATQLKERSQRSSLKPMPNRIPLPIWLRALKKIENFSVLVAFFLVSSAVLTYGWAVYSQQLWGKNYSRLDTLRRDERQLLKGSELMKNNIARHNDPKQYGLVPRNSEHIMVIPPAPLRPSLSTGNIGPEPKARPIMPIGY